MGVFDWLTGGGKTAEKVVDKVSSGIDYAFYTDQEKAEDGQKRLAWMLDYMKATAPQNVSRRVIAIIIVVLWAFLILLGVGLQLLGWVKDAEFVFNTLDKLVNEPFMIVMGFYFLAHVLRANREGKS